MTAAIAKGGGPGPAAHGGVGGRRVLRPDGSVEPGAITFGADGVIGSVSPSIDGHLDLGDDLLLPGIVDLHGDAFERCVAPRPGVHLRADRALVENDRQLLSAGITTSFLSATDSWEPGLRNRATLRELVDAVQRIELGAETHLHVRHEQTMTDDHHELCEWLVGGEVSMLSLNDHAPRTEDDADRWVGTVGRLKAFDRDEVVAAAVAAVGRRMAGADQVGELCEIARRSGVVVASHDVSSTEQILHDETLGVTIAEFPYTIPLARALHDAGTTVLMGAPNVVRGGSHLGNLAVVDAVAAGVVDVLCSDYHYPSLLEAPFALARDGRCSFAEAWAMVSANPAAAARLGDRGRIEVGHRADLVRVDTTGPVPRVRTVWRQGMVVADFPAPRR